MLPKNRNWCFKKGASSSEEEDVISFGCTFVFIIYVKILANLEPKILMVKDIWDILWLVMLIQIQFLVLNKLMQYL